MMRTQWRFVAFGVVLGLFGCGGSADDDLAVATSSPSIIDNGHEPHGCWLCVRHY